MSSRAEARRAKRDLNGARNPLRAEAAERSEADLAAPCAMSRMSRDQGAGSTTIIHSERSVVHDQVLWAATRG